MTTTTDPQHTFVKVELEIKVDGGGDELGKEVANIAHQWIWRHGRKVQNNHYGLLLKWSNINSESDCGSTKPRTSNKLEGGMATRGVDILHIGSQMLSEVFNHVRQERQLAVIFEDDAEVSPHW